MSHEAKHPLKQFPRFETDEEAEHFVDEADLSDYDFSGDIPLSEALKSLLPKNTNINIRLPTSR